MAQARRRCLNMGAGVFSIVNVTLEWLVGFPLDVYAMRALGLGAIAMPGSQMDRISHIFAQMHNERKRLQGVRGSKKGTPAPESVRGYTDLWVIPTLVRIPFRPAGLALLPAPPSQTPCEI